MVVVWDMCMCVLQARSLSTTPRPAAQAAGRRASQSAASGQQLQRQQEVALQRILEEEILKEMDREAALREVSAMPAAQGAFCTALLCCGSGGCITHVGARVPWEQQPRR
jgi:hypothetical protein